MLESHLSPVAKSAELADLDALAHTLTQVGNETLVNQVIAAMTTNETSFFRDQHPFALFKDFVLPTLVERRAANKRLKIWCSAASSGQEPYTLAMIMKECENTLLSGWKSDILGTDISRDILKVAEKALYSQFEVQRGLPIQMLMNHFTQVDDRWQLNDEIREMVRYEYFNLLNSMSGLGTFDVIFCRNVLIYFDEDTKTDILDRLKAQLAPDGFLYLGGAETVLGITDSFAPVPEKRGLYAPEGSQDLIKPEADQSNSSSALA